MSVQEVIERRAVALTVVRPGQEVSDYGFVSRTGSAVSGITGHMQPMSDKELRYVPEGMNTLEWWNIWSLAELRNGDQVTDGAAPTVVVSRVKYWREGQFWHAQGVLVTDETALTVIVLSAGEGLLPLPVGAAVGAHP